MCRFERENIFGSAHGFLFCSISSSWMAVEFVWVIAFWIGGVENKCHWLSNLGWLFHTGKIHGVEAAAAE
jgi:hypothetical protein